MNDYRNIHGTTVHFVKSGYLLKFNYAICCFVKPDFDYYAYRLGREYTECYAPNYGTGLTPESVPMLLEVAEFWCQYYFEQSLDDKFPLLMQEIHQRRIQDTSARIAGWEFRVPGVDESC